jgi:hypothetical protein
MKTVNTYLRKTDASAIEVDSTNRPLRNVAAVIRNEQAQINLRIFDGAGATTPMTGEQLAGYVSWHLRIGPQADMRGPVCIEAGNESITVSEAGVVSIAIAITDTVQAASEIGNATRAIWTADLAAFPVDSENPTMVLQWRIAYINRVASENEPPPEAQTSDFYQKPVIDAKFAAVGASIPAATTLARGTIQLATGAEVTAGEDTVKAVVPATLKTELDKKVDKETGKVLSDNNFTTAEKNKLESALTSVPDASESVKGILMLASAAEAAAGLDTGKAIVSATLKTELDKKESTANKATDFSTVNNIKFPTVQAVKDFAQNETLAELTGTEVTVAPWTQSKWSASGVCSLTATGWAVSGHQVAYVLITLAAEATLSVSDATMADDDALSAAGTYACYLINENGTVRFKVAGFTEAV